ncbi:MAG: hypothetical protein SWH78_07700 [Thermodesulfobacteriota bacterium]|nr:hypothetical protein [Thermodesulfobacteriota bacterium]
MAKAKREFKIVYDTDGNFLGVEAPGKDRRISPEQAKLVSAHALAAAGVSPDEYSVLNSESIETKLIDTPGKSICCIVHGGRLFCWC